MRKPLIYLAPIFLCVALLCGISASAARGAESPSPSPKSAPADTISASRAFLQMPLGVMDILSKENRQDMLGYYALDSIWVAKNALEGTSRLERVTPNYLKVILTDVSTLEIKVIPTKSGDMVVSLYTINGEGGRLAGDTQVSLFDANMKPWQNPKKVFSAPQVKSFFSIPKGSMTTMKELEQMVEFPTIVYTASPDNNDLKASLTVGEYMSRDDYNILKLFLLPSITLTWDGKRFK